MALLIKTFAYQSPEYHLALQLRDKVLRKPLGLKFTPEELKKDEHDLHFGLFENGACKACLTLTKAENGRMKMRQVAVDEAEQGQGLGKKLSLAAEKYAHENGYQTMFCHARKVATPFYLKLGYTIVGDEFTEVNIPHYLMEKKLS
ncbi:MAG TPA: GNAT family N-acetyltransferase [Chitinophagales bacterium]|nr:GNAT family N-acetyltransferase [Chitinophagales bacterium]